MKTNLRHPTLGFIWLLLPAMLAFVYVSTLVQYPLDFWFHVTTGRQIWQSGAIPTHDTFTFTIVGQPIINQCWLAQLGMFGLFSWGGFALAQFAAALFYAAAIGVITITALLRSKHSRVAAAMGVAALVLALSNFGVRNQAISFLFFATELLLLWCWPGCWITIIAIGIMEILWTNTHGAFPLGVVLPGLFLAGTAWNSWRNSGLREVLAGNATRAYAICLLAAAICAFCNPHPGRTLDYLFGVETKAVVRGIGEWEPSRLDNYTGIAFALSALATVIILALRRKHVTALDLLLLLPFAVLAVQHQRMVAWWGMVLATTMAPHMAELWRTWTNKKAAFPLPQAGEGRGEGGLPENDEKSSVFNYGILILLLVGLGMSTPWTRMYNPLLPPSKRVVETQDIPRAAAEFMDRVGSRGRVFSPLEWSAYFTWRLGPRIQVFIDGRVDFFSDKIWQDYQHLAQAGHGWQDILARYQINWVVWDKRQPCYLPKSLAQLPQWSKVYEDELVVAFERKGKQH